MLGDFRGRLRGCCERTEQSLTSNSESKRPRGLLQEISPIDIHFAPLL